MRRLDTVLIAVTLVLGTVWFFLRRQVPAPESAGSVTARATGPSRSAGTATPRPPARSSRPGSLGASGEPAAVGLAVEVDVPLAAGLDVVHKHTIGSCRGRLSATPAGLRYAASSGDDSFDVPLGSVERLDADYLKKQLTVKLRGGRTYNFTEAGGNADALVRFQQSVAKAQSRLAAAPQK
jgi:hypothetical protein